VTSKICGHPQHQHQTVFELHLNNFPLLLTHLGNLDKEAILQCAGKGTSDDMPKTYNKHNRHPRLSCKQVVQLVEAYIQHRSTAGVNVFAYINREVFGSIDRDISYDFKAATGGQYASGDYQYLITKRGRPALREVVALVEAVSEEDWVETLDELQLSDEARQDYLNPDVAAPVADRRNSTIRQYLKLVKRKEPVGQPIDRCPHAVHCLLVCQHAAHSCLPTLVTSMLFTISPDCCHRAHCLPVCCQGAL
jgi:hypothetical protein